MSIPVGATHKDMMLCHEFLKKSANGWEFWNEQHEKWYTFPTYKAGTLTVELQQPKPWSGPEDGLPPVGSNVELCGITTVAREEYDAYEHCVVDTWKNGDTLEVLAHKNIYGKDGVIVFNTRKMQASALMADCYRAIRTPQQLIDSARSSAIREIMDAAGIDCLVTATKLVDAGFKREVV